MTDIVIMLALLTGPYLLVRLISVVSDRELDATPAAAWGVGILFMFTGMGHFIQTEQLTWMLPDWVPHRTLIIYVTGILEFLIAAGLFIKKSRWLSSVAAIIVLIAFFPANVYAAFNYILMSGNEWGPIYLLVRGPLQVAIIFWAYWLVVKKLNKESKPAPFRCVV